MRLLISFWLLQVSVGDVLTFQAQDGAPEYLSTISPFNAFCPVRCPDEVLWPENEADLANYLQDVQERSPSTPVTVRGRGHSYTCQSTSSTGIVIDMRRLRTFSLSRRSNGMMEASIGAGLNSGEVTGLLEKKGWSIPHGVCSTVGMAGWLLNDGSHSVLHNYMNHYGKRDFVREIRGVTLLGSRLRIRGNDVKIVSRSPYESLASLQRKIAMAKKWKGGVQALFRKHGANMFIATEFKVEVREKPEPLAVEMVYELRRFKSVKTSIHKALLPTNSDLNCILALYPHMAARSHGSPDAQPNSLAMPESFSVYCLSWRESETKTSLCQKVQALLDDEVPVTCLKSRSSFAKLTQNEGFGWYPFYVKLFVPNMNMSGDIIDFVLDQQKTVADCRITEGGSVTALPAVFHDFRNEGDFWKGGYLGDDDFLKGGWLVLDTWLGDDPRRKDECIASVQKVQANFASFLNTLKARGVKLHRTSHDTHLPDCSVGDGLLQDVQWKHQLYGDGYAHLRVIKSLWDPNKQISFCWGVNGDTRNPVTCKKQFADKQDGNCVAARVSISKIVSKKSTEINRMCAPTRHCNDTCEWGCRLNPCCAIKDVEEYETTEPLYLLSQFDPADYNDFVAYSIIVVMVLTGFGFEILMAAYMAQKGMTLLTVHVLWRFAKACFPVLAFVSILGCLHGQSYSMFLFAIVLFKMGFPETTVYFGLAFSSPTYWLCFLNGITGIGMTLHHVGSIIAFAIVLQGIIAVDQQTVSIAISAVLIHAGTVMMDLAPGCGKLQCLMRFLGLVVALGFEFVLQAEIFAYLPFADFPLNLAGVLLSASHFMCLFAMIAYLVQYRHLSHFYVHMSAPDNSRPDDEENARQTDEENHPYLGRSSTAAVLILQSQSFGGNNHSLPVILGAARHNCRSFEKKSDETQKRHPGASGHSLHSCAASVAAESCANICPTSEVTFKKSPLSSISVGSA